MALVRLLKDKDALDEFGAQQQIGKPDQVLPLHDNMVLEHVAGSFEAKALADKHPKVHELRRLQHQRNLTMVIHPKTAFGLRDPSAYFSFVLGLSPGRLQLIGSNNEEAD